MDILHYFEEVDFDAFKPENHNDWKYTLGSSIEKFTSGVNTNEDLRKADLAVVGIPFDSGLDALYDKAISSNIRKELYLLARPEGKMSIIDFGDIRPSKSLKGNYKAIRDVVEYLTDQNLCVVIIGGSQDLSYGIVEAFKSNKLFTYSTIDPVLDVKKGVETLNAQNYLSRIFAANPELFGFNLLAYQGHLVPSEYFKKVKGLQQNLRLGRIRENTRLAEPILRNTNFLSFDVSAIKHSDAPSLNCSHPNGLRSEEACQLSKYAGLSNKLEVFGLFGYSPVQDSNQMAIQLFAQIIWYFMEGKAFGLSMQSRWDDAVETYQVDIKDLSKPITFLRNSMTDQWSMELQGNDNKRVRIACSEQDYHEACNNEIPDIWLAFTQKLDEILK